MTSGPKEPRDYCLEAYGEVAYPQGSEYKGSVLAHRGLLAKMAGDGDACISFFFNLFYSRIQLKNKAGPAPLAARHRSQWR